MGIGLKIKKLRKERGWTQRDLADRAKVSHPAVCLWENDKNEPSGEKLRELSAIFGVSLIDAEWIEGPSRARAPLIPVDVLAASRELPGGSHKSIEPTTPPEGPAFCFLMSDAAMAPKIERGDFVMVDTGRSPRPSDLVAITDAKSVSVRRYRRVDLDDSSYVELIPENADFPRIRVASAVRVLGVVVETRRIWA